METQNKKGWARRVLQLGLIALMLAGALTLYASHLRPTHNLEALRLSVSAAAAREGERMPLSLPSGAVSVNTANAEALDTLSGIGEKTVLAIIEEREAHGRFSYPADLLNVKGIGEKTLEKLLCDINFD